MACGFWVQDFLVWDYASRGVWVGSWFLGLGVVATGFLGFDVSGCGVSVQGFWVRVPAFRVPGFCRVCGVIISRFECSGFLDLGLGLLR